jgi:hypothetical protein
MKKFLVLSLFFVFIAGGKLFAQGDTLITKNREKIPCKIMEISETEIKYKKASYMDGPSYTMDKNKLSYIIYANGEKELVKEDELSINKTAEIIDRRRAIKIEPFAPTMNKFVVGYEQVLKVDMNLEIKAGLINSHLAQNGSMFSNYGNSFTSGGFFKGGVKFLLGQDYYIKGMKYAHPLKGRYIRIDAILSSFKTQSVPFNATIPNGSYYGYVIGKTDINTTAYGLMLNYGRQFILGNIMTLDYYIGLGYVGNTVSYSNANVPSNYRDYYFNSGYFYSHTTFGGGSAVAINAGLTLGFVLK